MLPAFSCCKSVCSPSVLDHVFSCVCLFCFLHLYLHLNSGWYHQESVNVCRLCDTASRRHHDIACCAPTTDPRNDRCPFTSSSGLCAIFIANVNALVAQNTQSVSTHLVPSRKHRHGCPLVSCVNPQLQQCRLSTKRNSHVAQSQNIP